MLGVICAMEVELSGLVALMENKEKVNIIGYEFIKGEIFGKKLVVALCGVERLFEKMLSNIKEVKARGAVVFSCSEKANKQIEREAMINVYIPKTHNLFTASVEIIPFQLFAYYVAAAKGCDIDKPRNLAKSVTVE